MKPFKRRSLESEVCIATLNPEKLFFSETSEIRYQLGFKQIN